MIGVIKTMTKEFNITGLCIPEKHYMVDISRKINRMMEFIEKGRYFTLNRPRQYGKTTALYLLSRLLRKNENYLVIAISFEGVGDLIIQKEETFSRAFLEMMVEDLAVDDPPAAGYLMELGQAVISLKDVSGVISELIRKTGKKGLLVIDEVDKTSNNQLFLSLLGMLRHKYLLQNAGRDHTFHSVILAGVHDVKI